MSQIRIRPYVPIEDAVLFDVVAKQNKIPIGKLLEFYLKESPTYKKHKKILKGDDLKFTLPKTD